MYPRAACLPYAIFVVWRDAAKQQMVAYPLHPQALQLNVRRAVMTTVFYVERPVEDSMVEVALQYNDLFIRSFFAYMRRHAYIISV